MSNSPRNCLIEKCVKFTALMSTENCLFTIGGNVLRVAAVGDLGAFHCQLAQKFDGSTPFQFCTSPPIEATRCYRPVLLLF